MSEAQQMAEKINAHIANGGRVWTLSYRGAKEIGNAFAEDESLMVVSGRARKPVCILPNYVTSDLRREWRNIAFR